jgi:hypothetical protein
MVSGATCCNERLFTATPRSNASGFLQGVDLVLREPLREKALVKAIDLIPARLGTLEDVALIAHAALGGARAADLAGGRLTASCGCCCCGGGGGRGTCCDTLTQVVVTVYREAN